MHTHSEHRLDKRIAICCLSKWKRVCECVLYISETSWKKGQAKQMPSRKPINKQSFRFQFSAQKKYHITWKFVPSTFADHSLGNGIEMHCRLYCCSWCRFAIAQQYIDVYCLWVWGERGPFVAVLYACNISPWMWQVEIGENFPVLVWVAVYISHTKSFVFWVVGVRVDFDCNQTTHSFQQLIMVWNINVCIYGTKWNGTIFWGGIIGKDCMRQWVSKAHKF